MINPWDGDPAPLLPGRLDLLAGLLSIDRRRLADWVLVRGMLAEVWAMQDGVRSHGAGLAVARALVAD